MKIRPFRTRYNREDNLVYDFQVVSSKNSDKYYEVEITIDELNDDLIIKTTCECDAKMKFQKHKDCKHIKVCLEALRDFEINFRREVIDESKESESCNTEA
jgi:hypothetical protein